jgi:hypothetical protein
MLPFVHIQLFLLKNTIPHFLVSEQLNNTCLSFFSKLTDYLPPILFLMTLSFHTPANNLATPLLSFPVQYSIFDILPQLKFTSLYSDNEIFSTFFLPLSVMSVF